ncbi:MAG: hypothetical protein IPM54_16130 [Polyangiaceae bacterium]|nr:hypothetical protein [Polyangiaceae bacterium]
MPSLEHDGIVELFRDNPELGPHILARLFNLPLPAHSQVRVADSSLGQLLPIEFRADLVLELLDESGKCVLAIVLESQRDIAPRKRFSWPVYVMVARAERECDAVLLVVAVDAEVAAWAAQPIDSGLEKGSVSPIVVGPEVLPEITDERAARQDMELAVLSAMAHGNGPHGIAVVLAALRALGDLDAEHSAVYFHIIWNMLREPMQRALEALVVQKRTREEIKFPPFIQVLIDKALHDGELKGFHDGELKGFHDGELEGEVKGQVKAVREKILRGAQRRGLALSAEQEALIRGCDDRALLDRWFDNVFDAQTAADLFR